MKFYMLLAAFCASCLIAGGEISESELDRLKRMVRIGSVQDKTERNDDREKIEVVAFYTNQDERDTDGFVLRLAVELEDKKKNAYLVEIEGKQGLLNTDYTGEDFWELHIPYEELSSLKVTGYAIQYGIMDGDEFVLLAEEYDDVDTLEELKERTQTPLTGRTVRLKHTHTYRDDVAEEQLQPPMRTVSKKQL